MHFKTLSLSLLAALPSALATYPTSGNSSCTTPSDSAGAAFALTNAPDDNRVIAFSRASSGNLTFTGSFSTKGRGIGVDFDTQGGLQLSADHRFLYAVSPADDKVSVFAVHGSCLELVQVVYAGDQPLAISLSAAHGLAYVLDGSVATTGIFGFTVDAGSGMLAPITNATIPLSSPIGVPGTVAFSPDGGALVVTNKVGSTLDVFSVDGQGVAQGPVTVAASSGNRPFGAVFRPDGALFVVESGLPVFTNAAVSTYALNNGSAPSLSPITKSEKNQQTDGCWVVLAGAARQFAYTANFVSGTVSSYTVADNGTVALIDGQAAFPGITSNPVDLAVTPDGGLLYNLLRGSGTVTGWKIQDNGDLASLGTFGEGQGIPVNNGASGLAVY